jgi:hypothetical protein
MIMSRQALDRGSTDAHRQMRNRCLVGSITTKNRLSDSASYAGAHDRRRAAGKVPVFHHERIQSAIDAHLAARGYAKVGEAQADFLVTHTVTVERRTQVQETRASVGYGRYGTHGGVGVGYGIPVETSTYHYKVGTLIIDVIDARQKRLVWRGSGERTLGEDQTPEKRTEIINATVNEILSRFPPASNKPK